MADESPPPVPWLEACVLERKCVACNMHLCRSEFAESEWQRALDGCGWCADCKETQRLSSLDDAHEEPAASRVGDRASTSGLRRPAATVEQGGPAERAGKEAQKRAPPQEPRDNYACETCAKKFESQKGLNVHVALMHCDNAEMTAEQQLMPTSTRRAETYARHACVFICDACAKSFDSLQGLKVHKGKGCPGLGSGGEGGKRPVESRQHARYQESCAEYVCRVCTKSFDTLQGLKVHKTRHCPGLGSGGEGGKRPVESRQHARYQESCVESAKEVEEMRPEPGGNAPQGNNSHIAFSVGDYLFAHYTADGQYYRCVLKEDLSGSLYRVQWCDGDKTDTLKHASELRLRHNGILAAPTRWGAEASEALNGTQQSRASRTLRHPHSHLSVSDDANCIRIYGHWLSTNKLRSLVEERGGFDVVTQHQRWPDISRCFGVFPDAASYGTAFKEAYRMFLLDRSDPKPPLCNTRDVLEEDLSAEEEDRSGDLTNARGGNGKKKMYFDPRADSITIGVHRISAVKLQRLVEDRGGFEMCTRKKRWSEVVGLLGAFRHPVNDSVSDIKEAYKLFLLEAEGEGESKGGGVEEEDANEGKWEFLLSHAFAKIYLDRDANSFRINGHKLSMDKLRELVEARGGFEVCTWNRRWSEIARAMGFPSSGYCTLLKKTYERLFVETEGEGEGQGEEEAEGDEEEDENEGKWEHLPVVGQPTVYFDRDANSIRFQGHRFSLDKLRELVEERGGFEVCTRDRRWAEIARSMGLPSPSRCTLLKKTYKRLFVETEGEGEQEQEEEGEGDEDEDANEGKWEYLFHVQSSKVYRDRNANSVRYNGYCFSVDKLRECVEGRGGFEACTRNMRWSEIARAMGVSKKRSVKYCTGVKRIYERLFVETEGEGEGQGEEEGEGDEDKDANEGKWEYLFNVQSSRGPRETYKTYFDRDANSIRIHRRSCADHQFSADKLRECVEGRGGFEMCTANRRWSDVARAVGFPGSGWSYATMLKKIYTRLFVETEADDEVEGILDKWCLPPDDMLRDASDDDVCSSATRARASRSLACPNRRPNRALGGGKDDGQGECIGETQSESSCALVLGHGGVAARPTGGDSVGRIEAERLGRERAEGKRIVEEDMMVEEKEDAGVGELGLSGQCLICLEKVYPATPGLVAFTCKIARCGVSKLYCHECHQKQLTEFAAGTPRCPICNFVMAITRSSPLESYFEPASNAIFSRVSAHDSDLAAQRGLAAERGSEAGTVGPELMRQALQIQKEMEVGHVCDACAQSFSSSQGLQNHKRRCRGSEHRDDHVQISPQRQAIGPEIRSRNVCVEGLLQAMECNCCLTSMGTRDVPIFALNCGHVFCNRPNACVSSAMDYCPVCAVPITTRTRLFGNLSELFREQPAVRPMKRARLDFGEGGAGRTDRKREQESDGRLGVLGQQLEFVQNRLSERLHLEDSLAELNQKVKALESEKNDLTVALEAAKNRGYEMEQECGQQLRKTTQMQLLENENTVLKQRLLSVLPHGGWTEHTSTRKNSPCFGQKYYHNSVLNVTQWQMPAEMTADTAFQAESAIPPAQAIQGQENPGQKGGSLCSRGLASPLMEHEAMHICRSHGVPVMPAIGPQSSQGARAEQSSRSNQFEVVEKEDGIDYVLCGEDEVCEMIEKGNEIVLASSLPHHLTEPVALKLPAHVSIMSSCDDHGRKFSQNSVGESEAGRKPWKITLTAEQAVEIYKKRSIGANMDSTSSCRSNEVAEQYGVKSKTIRDIWNRATWVKATRSEWNEQEEAMYIASQTNSNSTPLEGDASQLGTGADKKGSSAQKRTRGRPKGSRGLRPHVKRGQGSRYVRAPPDIALCNDDERQRVLNEGVPLVLSTLADDQEGDDVIHYQMCCVGEDFDKIDADEDLVLACLLSEHEANLSPTSSEPITADSSSAASIQGTRRKRGRPSKSAFKTSAQQPAATPAPSSEAAQHVMAMMMSGLEQLVKAGRTRMLDIPTQHVLTPQTPDEARHRQRDQSPLSVLSLAAAADVAEQEG